MKQWHVIELRQTTTRPNGTLSTYKLKSLNRFNKLNYLLNNICKLLFYLKSTFVEQRETN